MSDYALVRTRSAVSLCGARPTVLLSRTYSVPDLSVYVNHPSSFRYRPSWSSTYYYPYYSWRYNYPYRYRDYWLSDYSSYYPSYRSWFPYRNYYYSDYYYSPYYWYYPYSYFSRYKSYLYNNDPYYAGYIGSARYRNMLLNSMEDGVHKGMALYRQGTISFDQLHRNWLHSSSWFQRHKDWRQLYLWDKEQVRPSTKMEQNYQAEWVPGFNPN